MDAEDQSGSQKLTDQYGPLMGAEDVAHVLCLASSAALMMAVRRGSVRLTPRYPEGRRRVLFATVEVQQRVDEILRATQRPDAAKDPSVGENLSEQTTSTGAAEEPKSRKERL
jgi:hypothetical protein